MAYESLLSRLFGTARRRKAASPGSDHPGPPQALPMVTAPAPKWITGYAPEASGPLPERACMPGGSRAPLGIPAKARYDGEGAAVPRTAAGAMTSAHGASWEATYFAEAATRKEAAA